MSEIIQTLPKTNPTIEPSVHQDFDADAELHRMLEQTSGIENPAEKFEEQQAVIELATAIDDRDEMLHVVADLLDLTGEDAPSHYEKIKPKLNDEDIEKLEAIFSAENTSAESDKKAIIKNEADILGNIFHKWDAAQQRISESSNNNGDITRAQQEATVFKDALLSGELSAADKDIVLREIFKRVKPERLESFISLLNGVVKEAIVYEDLMETVKTLSVPGAEHVNFKVEHSDTQEDVNEGFDYALTANVDGQDIRILIDAKSSGVFRTMRDSGQLETVAGADSDYIGIKRNQNRDRIIVINPEGSSSDNSTIEYRRVTRKLNGEVVDRYIPSLARKEHSRTLSHYYSLLQTSISSEIVRYTRHSVLVG